ncbi:hypothetical protein GOBAR_DD03777 [Gossypium barbadense]|nr:hypothetical protein GOBAR_DD03777 [Gossypium barbadense]
MVNWKSLWKLHILPKAKEFNWGALKNIAPSKIRLRDKRVSIDVVFKRIYLMLCSIVLKLWGKLGEFSNMNFVDCFKALVTQGSNILLEEFCIICWCIWWARNQLIWSNKDIPPSLILSHAYGSLNEWQEVRASLGGMRMTTNAYANATEGQPSARLDSSS